MNKTQPVKAPEIGDLVVCRDDGWRSSMHLPDEPGIVVDQRKDQAKVFFPTIFGDCWIPAFSLARIKNPGTAAIPAWMQRVWYLARALESVLIEVERFGPEGNAVRVYHGEVEVERIDRIRADLGEELRYYALNPAGLHKIETSIAFVTVDREPPLPPTSPPDP